MTDTVFNRCIAARQWQNAAAIRGCSIDGIRMQFDKGYYREPAPVAKSPVEAPGAVLSPFRVHSRPANPNKPAPREWAVAVRARVAVVGLTLRQFSESIGHSAKTVQTALSPSGHCSPALKARVEAGLWAVETESMRGAAE